MHNNCLQIFAGPGTLKNNCDYETVMKKCYDIKQ